MMEHETTGTPTAGVMNRGTAGTLTHRVDAGTFAIREMTVADLPQVIAIEKTIFTQPWSENSFKSSMSSPYTHFLVVEDESCGKIAAYCGYLQSLDEADITNVAVDEVYRRRGLARMMLEQLMADGRGQGIERYTLEVRVSNEGAIHLYEQLGFKTEGIRPRFYALPTEDAAIMWTPKMDATE